MACETLENIELGCERNSGGLHQIIVGDLDTIDVTVDPATWRVTAATASEPPIQIEVKRKTSNFIEDEQNDFVNGSVVVTTTVTAMIHRRDALKSRALNILGAGQRYLYMILKDGNGKFWYLEYAQKQSTGEGSGQERADGSKYSVVFVAEEDHLMYEIDPAVVAQLLAMS